MPLSNASLVLSFAPITLSSLTHTLPAVFALTGKASVAATNLLAFSKRDPGSRNEQGEADAIVKNVYRMPQVKRRVDSAPRQRLVFPVSFTKHLRTESKKREGDGGNGGLGWTGGGCVCARARSCKQGKETHTLVCKLWHFITFDGAPQVAQRDADYTAKGSRGFEQIRRSHGGGGTLFTHLIFRGDSRGGHRRSSKRSRPWTDNFVRAQCAGACLFSCCLDLF